MTVFAIDPGPHTGIVWRELNGAFISVTLDFTVDEFQVDPHYILFCWLGQHVLDGDKVICEKFEFQKVKQDRASLNYDAGEYVGVVKLYCQREKIDLVMQSPSLAVGEKAFWIDDKLKRAGLYKGRKTRHERDALRHWLHHHTTTLGNNEYLYLLKK